MLRCLTQCNGAVILEHCNKIIGDCFIDCANCLIAFANNKSSISISLKAIALLRICEDRLTEVCFQLYNFFLKISGEVLETHMNNYYKKIVYAFC